MPKENKKKRNWYSAGSWVSREDDSHFLNSNQQSERSMNRGYGQQQLMEQKQVMAHDLTLIFDTFYNVLEALEEYIEKSGNYPNFINKRQVYRKTIPQGANLSLNRTESLFRTQLLIFAGMDKPDFLSQKVKKEYYKWINAVEIDASNCFDEKLKHFLLEINNVLDGEDEKIISQTKEYLDRKEKSNPIDPWSTIKVFNAIQNPLDKNREQAELLKDKTYKDIKLKKKFSTGFEQGKETFNQIVGTISNHNEFNFFSQEKREMQLQELREAEEKEEDVEMIDVSQERIENSQQDSLQRERFHNKFEIIKQYKHEWIIEEVVISLGCNYDLEREVWIKYGDEKKEKLLAYHEDLVESKIKYYDNGDIVLTERMFAKRHLGDELWNEIEQDLNNWSVKEDREEISQKLNLARRKSRGEIKCEYWETKEGLEGWIVHLEKKKKSIGGWLERERKIIMDKVRSESDFWIIKKINSSDNPNSELEEVLVHLSVCDKYDDKILIGSGKFYQKNFFSDEEWTRIKSFLLNQKVQIVQCS
jgi:hypothetical protein